MIPRIVVPAVMSQTVSSNLSSQTAEPDDSAVFLLFRKCLLITQKKKNGFLCMNFFSPMFSRHTTYFCTAYYPRPRARSQTSQTMNAGEKEQVRAMACEEGEHILDLWSELKANASKARFYMHKCRREVLASCKGNRRNPMVVYIGHASNSGSHSM